MLDLRVDARAWPLVGRERQLELIRRALKERNSVVVCGTAGVGKTSLMRNVLRRAAADGNAVEWVAATQSSASMPLGAYAHLLPPVTTGYANRALLLSATIRTVIDRARSRPLIVAVDDAHLLDPGSATLTFMLHSTGAARVIATVRSDVASPDAIAACGRSGTPYGSIWSRSRASRCSTCSPPSSVDRPNDEPSTGSSTKAPGARC